MTASTESEAGACQHIEALLAARNLDLEQRLADTEASFRSLLERIPAMVYTAPIEAPSMLSYVSPGVETLFGEKASNCVGDPGIWDRWLYAEDAPWVHEECERTNETGEPFVAEYRVNAKGGEVRWVRDEAVLVTDPAGQPRFWQGILTDVTDARRSLEKERAAAEHLRALDELKTTFMQAVSHDLRTPLTTVLGSALTLERSFANLPTDDVADLLGRLVTNARKLYRLLEDLLDLDRLTKGSLAPRRSPVDLGELVRRVVEESSIGDERVVKLDLPALRTSLDGPKVERIVENLLGNLRHTPADTMVWIRLRATPEGALLIVEDDGSGVPPELRDKIFQPFRQADSANAHAPGSGIGLALVARFATLHGGRAWVEDRHGGGASFRVLLPDAPR
ncbi:MAG TPA: ATP-binding protein [Actinomycetota bacterium]